VKDTGTFLGTSDEWSERLRHALRKATTGSTRTTVLAIVLAMLVGAVLIAAANPEVQDAAGYFFARPGDFFMAVGNAVWGAYWALFSGSVINFQADSVTGAVAPLSNTLTFATPLILAGLGLGVAFRSGLFNIGAQGQVLLGALLGGYIGFAWHLPAGLHLLVAVVGAAVGGAVWAGIAGVLKARTGANEVIVTIMLNNVAVYFVEFMLFQDAFKRPNSNNPQSPVMASTSVYPQILGPDFSLHLGFLVALAAAAGVWWLMERSTLGFTFRAVGANPAAARTAGISVNAVTVWVMVIAGALAGLAGSAQILGLAPQQGMGIIVNIGGTIGFDAITVALLGRSKPGGIVWAGILFGALHVGAVNMQAMTSTPIDIILVVQSMIVLFIAAPPLVKAVFGMRTGASDGAVTLTTATEAKA
jgi:general nucleoside transport system permease protein